MNIRGKTVLVTGGGSGIGLAIAKAFVGLGNDVIVCGRDSEKLDRAAAEYGVGSFVCDITDGVQQDRLIEHITTKYGRLDVLVNNAGVLHAYNFAKDTDTLSLVDHEITLNTSAELKLTYRALPLLRRSEQAAIVYVTSGTVYTPSPFSLVYTGTKSLVHHFADSLRVQLKPEGILVFEIQPPPTDTGMADNVKAKFDMSKFKLEHPDTIARALVRGMQSDKYTIAVGLSKVMRAMSRLAPGLLFRQMSTIVPE